MTSSFRVEHDSMGELKCPRMRSGAPRPSAPWRTSPSAGSPMPRGLHRRARAGQAGGGPREPGARAARPAASPGHREAAAEVAAGQHDRHFPIDVFQTGSGTSTNMNANEVIAALASARRRRAGASQRSRQHGPEQQRRDPHRDPRERGAGRAADAAAGPGASARDARRPRSRELADIVKTGRTHLMDAMPVTLGQELSGWRTQIEHGMARVEAVEPRLHALAQGGTAVGTGINAHPRVRQALLRRAAGDHRLPVHARRATTSRPCPRRTPRWSSPGSSRWSPSA